MGTTQDKSKGISRRNFMGKLGAGAVASMSSLSMSNAFADRDGDRGGRGGGGGGGHDNHHGNHHRGNLDRLERLLKGRHVISSLTFTRMFPNLRPAGLPEAGMTAALTALGALGGPMDAKDPLEGNPRRPILLLTDPANSVNNRDNPRFTAGITFLGQFVDHDFTFDQTTRLNVPVDPAVSRNTRNPALDLDSVYGGGPQFNPELYVNGIGPKMIIENGGLFEDLPRMADGTPIIADPRNDENTMLSGLQAAMIMFHNAVVDFIAAKNRKLTPEQ